MAKSKQRELVPATAKRKKRAGASEVDLLGEDGWVVVKKQRVTIIIPPSPVSKKLSVPRIVETQTQPSVTGAIEMPSESKDGKDSEIHSTSEREEPKSTSPVKATQNTRVICSVPILSRPSQPGDKFASQNFHVDISRGRMVTSVYSCQKVINRPAISAGGTSLINQRLRAVILDKKMKKAGGMSNWLVSLGLDQFVKIFQCKKVNKFQLASLTMEKLKNMGAHAVGPRRKLLHAIDCLCQPYCFEH